MDLLGLPYINTPWGLAQKYDPNGVVFTDLKANSLTLDTLVNYESDIGKLTWDIYEGVPRIGLDNNVTLQIGQENIIKVYNNSGQTITNGTPVFIINNYELKNELNETVFIYPTIAIARADDIINAPQTIAITTEEILNNSYGFVTSYGMVRGIDCSALIVGKPVYLSVFGGLTAIEPSYPNVSIKIGTCISNDSVLGKIHVDINYETFKKGFDVIKQPIGVYSREESTLTYNSSTRTITIAVAANHNYWAYFNKGIEYRITNTVSLTHDSIQGGWYFYVNSNNEFILSQTPWDILSDIPLSFIYYNTITNSGHALEERHGATRNPEWHKAQHKLIGTYYDSGLAATGYNLLGTTDADNRFIVDTGVIYDEDLKHQIVASSNTSYNIAYRSGPLGIWRREVSNMPYSYGTYSRYNNFNGTNWVLTEITNSQYFNIYVVASPGLVSTDMVWNIVGQKVYSSLDDATNALLTDDVLVGDAPLSEYVIAHRFTLRGGSSYTTLGKTRIEAYKDLRGVSTRSGIGSSSSGNGFHDSLSGVKLATLGTTYGHIDDQTQTIYGDKTFYNNLTIGGNLTINGTTTTIDTQTVLIEDNVLTINKNQTGTPLSTLISGIEVERGDLTNYNFIFRELDEAFAIGLVGSEQAVATREDSPSTNCGITIWDSVNRRFNTTTATINGNVLSIPTVCSTTGNFSGDLYICGNQYNSVSGNGVIYGSQAASCSLYLRSTSNATKGSVRIDEICNSTSTTTGALIVSGGVGVACNVNVGGCINGNTLGVSSTSNTSGAGISLYNGATSGQPTYGLMFAGTSTFGCHGSVTADWATYFTMNNTSGRGWIFKCSTGTSGNIASISNTGNITASGAITGANIRIPTAQPSSLANGDIWIS